MPVEQATKPQSIDPLAEQAASLLAKAMVTSHERERLWSASATSSTPPQRNSRRPPYGKRLTTSSAEG